MFSVFTQQLFGVNMSVPTYCISNSIFVQIYACNKREYYPIQKLIDNTGRSA